MGACAHGCEGVRVEMAHLWVVGGDVMNHFSDGSL